MKVFGSAALLAVLLMVAGCGGGGDGSNEPQAPATSISLDKTVLNFAAGSQIEAANDLGQTVVATFKGAGVVVGTLPGQTLPAWLYVSAAPVQTSPASIQVRITGILMPAGRYSTVLRFASGNADQTNIVYKDVTINYTYDHSISPGPRTLRSYAGTGTPRSTMFYVTTANASWNVTSSVPWLTAAPASGTGNGNFIVTANAANLTEGEYSGTIAVTDPVTNRSRTADVLFEVDQGGIDLGSYGLAFVDTTRVTTPSSERRLGVSINLPGTGVWTAVADVPWLSVTPGFTGSANIGILASSNGLADGLYYGRITFASNSDPLHPATAVLRVGFYVDHSSVNPVMVSSPDLGNIHSIIADPIRPYIYTTNSSAVINVVNVYSGVVEDTITVPGGDLRQMEVSPDGSYLYVANVADSSVVPITLDTRIASTAWSGMRFHTRMITPTPPIINDGLSLKFARLSGLPVLMTGERQLLSTVTGAVVLDFSDSVPAPAATSVPILATAWDGTAFYMASRTTGSYELVRYKVSNRNGVLKVDRSNTFTRNGDAAGLLTLSFSNNLFEVASNAASAITVYDGTPMMSTLSGYQLTGPLGISDVDFSLTPGTILVTSSSNKTLTQYDYGLLTVRGTPRNFIDVPILARYSSDEQRIAVAVSTASGSQLQFFDAIP